MGYGSSIGIQQLLNNPHVSHRKLREHLFLIFSYSAFDVGRSMFDVHFYLVSYSIKLNGSAIGGRADIEDA
jgi:hypothetical protein